MDFMVKVLIASFAVIVLLVIIAIILGRNDMGDRYRDGNYCTLEGKRFRCAAHDCRKCGFAQANFENFLKNRNDQP